MVTRSQLATEEYVIRAAAERFGWGKGKGKQYGIGDDAAVLDWWPRSRTDRLVVTTDVLIEGVHFDLRYMSLEDVGWKALVANVSDRAAMGAEGGWAVMQLGIPLDARRKDVAALLNGVLACSKTYQVRIVGGDTVASPQWLVGFTLTSEARHGVMLRSTARPGDAIYLGCDGQTDRIGHSQMGLFHVWGKLNGLPPLLARQDVAAVTDWHRRPKAPDGLGRWLASLGCRCCIDTSDSLAQSLLHVARASNVSVQVSFGGGPFAYDYDFALERFAERCGWPNIDGAAGGITVPAGYAPDALTQVYASLAEFMLSAAEDYQLLFVLPPKLEKAMHGNPANLIKIGTIGEPGRQSIYVDEFGRKHKLTDLGWKHR